MLPMDLIFRSSAKRTPKKKKKRKEEEEEEASERPSLFPSGLL